jgi:hypothetical protein
VRAADPAERTGPVIDGTVTCSHCHAINRSGAHFCVECEEVLDQWATVSTREEEDELRREAAKALRDAYSWIGGVTWFYRVAAFAYAVATAFAVGALTSTDVPLQGGLIVVLLTSSLSVLMLMGAMLILFRPFAWAVAIAVLATIVSAVHLVGPNPFGIAFAASVLLAFVAWAALVPTFRFRRLIAEHTDLYILHHSSKRTRRSLAGRFSKERHERLLDTMERAARRAWKRSSLSAAALCVMTALMTFLVVSNERPQHFDEGVVSFETTWNDEGPDALGPLFDPKVSAAEVAWLVGVADGHWGTARPKLAGARVRREGDRISALYEMDGMLLEATWVLKGQAWRLIDVELPVPPFEPVLEGFLDAWRASDPRALAAFFSESTRVSMTMSIEASVKERSWASFPAIEEVDTRGSRNGEATVVLDLTKGKVQTEWRLRPDGTWGLVTLKFPRRWKRPESTRQAATDQ